MTSISDRKQRLKMLRILYLIGYIILCTIHESQADSSTQVYTEKAAQTKVFLKPPTNLTVELVSENDIFVKWAAPDVYPMHVLNDSYVNTSKADADYWVQSPNNMTTTPGPSPTSGNAGTAESSTVPDGDATKPPNKVSPAKSLLPKPKCMTENDFKDINHLEVFLGTINHAVFSATANTKETKTKVEVNGTNIPVDFDKGCVEKYVVYFRNNETGEVIQRDVSATMTEYHMQKLPHLTTYDIYVSAVFTSSHILNSTTIRTTTLNNSKDVVAVCHCSQFGSVPGSKCDLTQSNWCKCKPQYTGEFCELCRPGYYRSASYFPCNRCPCSPLATSRNTCNYREGFLVCDSCSPNYSGHLCQTCVNGFYRYHGRCIPCECNNNNDQSMARMCDPYTGACTKCVNNTTGIKCEKCLPGYVRDDPDDHHCVWHKNSKMAKNAGPSKGLIAAICIVVILAICAVVGFIVYRRWHLFPPRKPFWTVELKEDHDSINFSSIPGQDYIQHNAADIQDLDFYENHRGKSSGKNVSSYSQLKEVM